jgi:hypothetical protein
MTKKRSFIRTIMALTIVLPAATIEPAFCAYAVEENESASNESGDAFTNEARTARLDDTGEASKRENRGKSMRGMLKMGCEPHCCSAWLAYSAVAIK